MRSSLTIKSEVRATLIAVMVLGCAAMAGAPKHPAAPHDVRGYVTSAAELSEVAKKASRGIQPYRDAVLAVTNYANTGVHAPRRSDSNPAFWPYGTIGGAIQCSKTFEPAYLGKGSPLVEAKALVYRLTGDRRYAADVRKHLFELADSYGYGGRRWSQCIVNLSWYVPGWIIAADLIDDYPGWSTSDKLKFQRWLATEVYPKTDWASDVRSNNHGSAGSAASAMIADYLADSGLSLVDRNNEAISPGDAYQKAKQRQLDRMNGNAYMRHEPGCSSRDLMTGIRPDGGIPWELARGSAGCDGAWAGQKDGAWTYQQTHIEATLLHAELLLRRGDNSLYDNVTGTGAGSIRKAIIFIIHNPNDPKRSLDWYTSHLSTLELAYRYYRDPHMAEQLGINTPRRVIAGPSGQMLHFGTLTHGFAAGENAGPPPTIAPPSPSRVPTRATVEPDTQETQRGRRYRRPLQD